MVFKAGGQETDGGLFVMEYTAQARFAGPPPHAHPHADEAFYVLEGTLTLRRAEGDVEAAAGSFCYVPRGVAHTFANRTDVPARFLSLMTPAGFEGYLEELATVVQPGVPMPGPDVFAALNKKYDQVPAVLPGA